MEASNKFTNPLLEKGSHADDPALTVLGSQFCATQDQTFIVKLKNPWNCLRRELEVFNNSGSEPLFAVDQSSWRATKQRALRDVRTGATVATLGKKGIQGPWNILSETGELIAEVRRSGWHNLSVNVLTSRGSGEGVDKLDIKGNFCATRFTVVFNGRDIAEITRNHCNFSFNGGKDWTLCLKSGVDAGFVVCLLVVLDQKFCHCSSSYGGGGWA